MKQAATDQRGSRTIGLVTVFFKSGPVIPGFFESLAGSDDAEIDLIVICNDQDPESAELARRLGEENGIPTTVIENTENLGVAEANNQGLRICLERGHSYILIANNDIEFGSDVIAGSRDALAQGYDAVSPLITYFDEPSLIWYGGGSINTVLARTSHHGDLTKVDHRDVGLRPTGYAPTCFLLLRRAVLDRIGMMDPGYFVYYDDSDFIWRFARAGLRLGYAPGYCVRHKVSSSTGGASSPFVLYYANRNRVRFIRKNIPIPAKWIAIGYMLLTKAVRLPFTAREQRGIILKALRDGFAMSIKD